MSAPHTDPGVPTLVVGDPEQDLVRILREAQYLLLAHPVAAQAAFSAFVAEGRRFAETSAGRAWSERLAGSELMQKGRVAWEVVTMKLLEESPPDVLPQAYVQALAKAAASPELEPLLSRLFLRDA